MTSKYFAEKLRAIQVDTPLTTKFENELDDNGKRKYAQLNNRWWDNSTGTQKEHLICWFSRKYYTDGSTQKCIEDNYSRCCKDCYFKKNNQYKNLTQTVDAKIVFNHMRRPEMYFWIAESLNILEPDELAKCIKEVQDALESPNKKWKAAINKYILWEDVESKIDTFRKTFCVKLSKT